MPPNEYSNFSADDFAANSRFIDWCLHPTDELNSFWEQWIVEHPGKKQILQEAKSMVLLLQKAERKNHNTAIKKDIWNNLEAHITTKEAKIRPISRFYHWKSLATVAASLLLIFFVYHRIDQQDAKPQWVSQTNTTDKSESITLSDSSVVDLGPNATLQYYAGFDAKQREVILQGEAFFDIKRDTTKPFLIYANETITKVLGTSFTIKANTGSKKVEVEVATGKVAVFSNTKKGGRIDSVPMIFKKGKTIVSKPNTRIYLSPNEKVTYDLEEKSMVKSIVNNPRLIKSKESTTQYKFNNAPIAKVFSTLESAYGIQMEYNDEALLNCSISTELDDAPMFTKLEMICTALELEYEEKDGIIYIEGEGCE